MKPREIAISLYNKTVDLLPNNANTVRAVLICQKHCDYFIEYLGIQRDMLGVKYWLDVKQELEKL